MNWHERVGLAGLALMALGGLVLLVISRMA